MDGAMQMMAAPGEMSFSRPTEDTLLVRLAGDWTIKEELPAVEEVQQQADSGPPVQRIAFDTQDLGRWDSVLITFLIKLFDQFSQSQINTNRKGLPEGVRRLLDLAAAVPEKKDVRKEALREPLLVQVGRGSMDIARQAGGLVTFLGESTIALGRLCSGRRFLLPTWSVLPWPGRWRQ
jgi:phospholipid/cholesterol/gamma-HCH transport system permease protein